MRKLFSSFLIFIIANINAQEIINASLIHNGTERFYTIYVPEMYNEQDTVPLLFNFHGYTMNVEEQMFLGDMRSVADTAGFILVYPLGTLLESSQEEHWNVGGWTIQSTADDIGFTQAMIDQLLQDYNINEDRIYSCGYSNGGYFSFKLACQLSDKIAAIGCVGGSMTPEVFENCNPSKPTSIIKIHGDQDFIVGYNGNIWTIPIDDVISYWVSFNNTDSVAIVSYLPDLDTNDGSTVQKSAFIGGDNETAVELYKVIGGGHDWPGNTGNKDFNAGQAIWNFVSQYDINGLIKEPVANTIDEQLSDFNFLVYPNPSAQSLHIDNPWPVQVSYTIVNGLGQNCISGTLYQGGNIIATESLEKGFYLLKMGRQTIKIQIL